MIGSSALLMTKMHTYRILFCNADLKNNFRALSSEAGKVVTSSIEINTRCAMMKPQTPVSAVRYTAGIQRQLTRTYPKYHPSFTAGGRRINSIASPPFTAERNYTICFTAEGSGISHLRLLSCYINELERKVSTIRDAYTG